MNFESFLTSVQRLTVIQSEGVRHLFSTQAAFQVQLARWVRQGRLLQLRRGIYLLAEPYRQIRTDGYYLASVLESPSYISAEKALEYHGLIPEAVPVYTSVTTGRSGRYETPAGTFDYRHIRNSLFWGYEGISLTEGETAFVAEPEKALLDLLYLRRVRLSSDYLEELRLQNVEKIRKKKLTEYAARFGRPRMEEAAEDIGKFIRSARLGEKVL